MLCKTATWLNSASTSESNRRRGAASDPNSEGHASACSHLSAILGQKHVPPSLFDYDSVTG